MIAPPLRASAIFPKWAALIHLSKLVSEVRPRVSVTSPAFGRPGNFLLMYLPSAVLCFISMTSCSILSPLTSWMALIKTPSISRPKEWPADTSSSCKAMGWIPSLGWSVLTRDCWGLDSLGQAGAAGELRQAEDHEFGRLHRSDSDLADHHAGVDGLGRVGFSIAPHEEGFVRSEPEQGPLAPLVDEEGRDGSTQLRPQGIV